MARPKTATRKLADFNPFNAINRGVYIADNLDFLRAINTASVDLVCIDPPFAKNDTFTGDRLKPPLTRQEIANEKRLLKEWGIATAAQADEAGVAWPDDPKARGGYEDTWSWDDDVHPDWVTGIKATHEAVNLLIEATRQIHGDSIAAYLAFMAIRLFEIHRILKPTGSLYLHCDNTADGYLRQLLDGVFGSGGDGKGGFRNAITWRRTHSKNAVSSRYGTNHDTIFYYGKSAEGGFYKDQAFRPYGGEVPAGYSLDKKTGRYYALSPVYGDSPSKGDSGLPATFRGVVYDVPEQRHWRVPGGRRAGETTSDGWARLDAEGRMYLAPGGKLPMFIRYLDEMPGIALDDVWTDIKIPGSKERTGYPTQKPIALAERIIQASTNPGDVVLDCFAGCAYVALAAEKLDRKWTACDINLRAWTVFKRQFNKGGNLPLLACNDRTTGQQVMGSEPEVTIHGPAQLPKRTEYSGVEVKSLRTDNRRPAGSKYRGGGKETTLLNKDEMLRRLLGISYGRAWCCGLRSAGTAGEIIPGNYELDHVTPKSMGGDDEIYNRAPLCSRHNGRKGNRDITLDELRVEVAFAGELAEGMTPQSLIRLDEARRQAQHIFAEEYQRQHGKAWI